MTVIPYTNSKILESPTPAESRELNRALYADGPWLAKNLQVWRPLICPLDPIIRSVPIGSDVLDMGCGRGMVLLNLAAAGRIRSGIGVEISEQLVAEANAAKANFEQVLGHKLDIEFIYREAEQIFDFDQHFDTVMTVDVLHHVPVKHQSDFVRSLMARVKDGGTLVYKDMCQKPFWRAAGNRFHDLVIARQWINYYPMQKCLDIIKSDPEWEEPSLDTYSRLWYGHELAVAKKNALLNPEQRAHFLTQNNTSANDGDA